MYQIREVERITGLTRRQIDYLDRSSLVEATYHSSGGKKQARFWSFVDLVALRTVRKLREENVSLQKIRKVHVYVKRTWPDLGNHLAQLTFYVLGSGQEVLVLGPDDQFPVSALRAQGQRVLVLPGVDVIQEVKEAIRQLADDPLSPEEARESSQAWQDYIEGKDPGETLAEVRAELLGDLKEKRRA
ncbi:MAG: MerR family transcriptional regulator [bacterium]|jgi:hypothetical protein